MELVVVAALWIHPGAAEAFRAYEAAALRIMARHGGRLKRVIRPLEAAPPAALPHEIHVLTFPSRERFTAYRADPELIALAPARQAAIARTELIIGEPGAPYPSPTD